MTSGRPWVSDLHLANHATDPFDVVINLPRDFILTQVVVVQVRGTLAGFNAVVSLPVASTMVGYENNSQTLILAEAALAAALTTITVAGAASKGVYDCNLPTQARDSDGISADGETMNARFTVTTPGSGKLFGVLVRGVVLSD